MTCLFHYTPVLDLCEAHIANQQYSPFTMADNPFSSALPPSLPPTIPPLNNNINKVPKQEKTSKFGQELTDVAPKLDMDNTPAASGSLPSLCYHSILPPPSAAHSNSHASNAVPIPERTTFLRKKFSIPPMDNTALILKILSPQAQRLWRWMRLPPRLSHHASTQTYLMKT